MASTELQAIVRFRFHDGDVGEFKRLSAQCMEIVRTQDTGTLRENLGHLMDAITATGSVFGELLGEPSAELRARFTGGGPVQLFTPWVTM